MGRVGEQQGHPRSAPQFAVATPSKSQSQIWKEFGCSDRVDAQAYGECKGCTERLKSVRAIVLTKEFALIYLPLAVVSYTANQSPYRHFVNLVTGNLSGDIPLDERSIRNECRRAGEQQQKLAIRRWFVASTLCPALGYLIVHLWHGETDVFTATWWLWLFGLWFAWFICEPSATPWINFLWHRRAYLLRLLADPPHDLKQPMHHGHDVDRLKGRVRDMADQNSLEHVMGASVITVLQHPGKVLLDATSPYASLRLPMLVVAALPLLLTIGVVFSTVNSIASRDPAGRRVNSGPTQNASIDRPQSAQVQATQVTEPSAPASTQAGDVK